MARVVDDPYAAAVTRYCQRCCEFKLLLRTQRAVQHRIDMGGGHAAAEAKLALAVEEGDCFRHPVVAAGHVVQRQIVPDWHTAFIGARPGDRAKVAGLAAVVTRRRRIFVVAVGGAALRRRVVHCFERAALQVSRQRRIVRHQRLRDQTGFVFAEGALDDAVRIGRVVESGLAIDGRAGHASGRYRVGRRLRAVIVGEVADRGIGDVVTGAAKITVAVKLRLHELVARVGIVVGAELVAAAPERAHA